MTTASSAPAQDPPRRVLLVYAHPAIGRSRANRALLAAARTVEGLTLHDLYDAYPDFDVDVAREQELLAAHDVLVLQHPFFWYSTPALVKQWEDLVLEHGWAYGSKGNALRGKWWMQAVTAGGPETSYCSEGRNRFSIRSLLRPLEQTARLCGMRYLPPFLVQGTHGIDDAGLAEHAREYAEVLRALQVGSVDFDALSGCERLRASDLLQTATPGGDV